MFNRNNKQARLGSASEQPPVTMTIQYAHNDTQVVILFPQVIRNLFLTEQQVDDLIAALLDTKNKLIEHQRKVSAGEIVDAASNG